MASRKSVRVRHLQIGGGAPIVVQGMTKTDTRDAAATREEIERLTRVGAELVRVAVPDREAAEALPRIVSGSPVPVVADIHFDYRLALAALSAGVDKLRLNPGNIGSRERVREVVREARDREVPIRIGVNAGSLEKHLLERYGGPTPEAMVESALAHVGILEELDFDRIVISLKASDVPLMVRAYQQLAERVPYPLHLGVTEAGTPWAGTIRTAVGLGALLLQGIGDTLRVSLTGPGEEEIRVGYEILRALHLRERGVHIVSCPTCGRCEVDLVPLAQAVERRLADVESPMTVAIMGCAVNGPGEARHAHVGVAGGKGEALLFRNGSVVGKVAESELVDRVVEEARAIAQRIEVTERG